jgi:hypothetical protein
MDAASQRKAAAEAADRERKAAIDRLFKFYSSDTMTRSLAETHYWFDNGGQKMVEAIVAKKKVDEAVHRKEIINVSHKRRPQYWFFRSVIWSHKAGILAEQDIDFLIPDLNLKMYLETQKISYAYCYADYDQDDVGTCLTGCDEHYSYLANKLKKKKTE